MSPLASTLMWIGIAIVAIVLLYLLLGPRRRGPSQSRLAATGEGLVDPAVAAFANADGEPPTEDQIARARLGGVRGAPKLREAPLPPQAREQTPRKIDDGYVA
jgi:hypothetical protein